MIEVENTPSFQTARATVQEVRETLEEVQAPGLTAGLRGSVADGFEAIIFAGDTDRTTTELNQVAKALPSNEGGKLSTLSIPIGFDNQPETVLEIQEVVPGTIYRIRPYVYLGGFDYKEAYTQRKFIHVMVLDGPDDDGKYLCTTRGPDGKHLGPGGGWTQGNEPQTLFLPNELERIF